MPGAAPYGFQGADFDSLLARLLAFDPSRLFFPRSFVVAGRNLSRPGREPGFFFSPLVYPERSRRVPGNRREVSLTLLMDFRSERRKTSGNLGRTWRRECLRLRPPRRSSNPRNEPSSFDSGLTRPDESRLR